MIKREKISPKVYDLTLDDGSVERIFVKEDRDYSASDLLAIVDEVRNASPDLPVKSVADELSDIKVRLDRLEALTNIPA